MFDFMDEKKKNKMYNFILNSQSHNELLDCVKCTVELKEKFSGMQLNRVNCTKEKIIGAFLGLYEKNKIIEKIIMDRWKEEISKYKKDIQEINSKKDIVEYIKLKKLKEERAGIFISCLLTHENK